MHTVVGLFAIVFGFLLAIDVFLHVLAYSKMCNIYDAWLLMINAH